MDQSNPIHIGIGMQMLLLLTIDQFLGKIGDMITKLLEFVIKDLADLAGPSQLQLILKALTPYYRARDQFQIYLNRKTRILISY